MSNLAVRDLVVEFVHDGYAVRRDFYNLYHVLNHANLFSGSYVEQSARLIERLIAEIR